jgi:hypothetical protein
MCVAENSLEDLRKSVRLNSTLWGGVFNPIIPIGSDIEFARTLVKTFRVDALFSVSETPEVATFVDSLGYLPWPDIERTLFIDGVGGPLPVFLDVYHPLRKLQEFREKHHQRAPDGDSYVPKLLTRPKLEGSRVDDAVLCTIGEYPDGDYCPINYSAFADRLLGTEYLWVTRGHSLPEHYWRANGPLNVTRYGLSVHKDRGAWNRPGLFVGNFSLFSDLIEYWNLRAAGVDVLFLPEDEKEVALAGAQSWMATLTALLSEQEPSPFNLPAIWSPREQDWASCDRTFGTRYSRHILSNTIWNGLNVKPPRVHFEEQSVLGTLDEAHGEIAVAFPLPPKPFLEDPESSYQHAIVTARPLIDPKPTVGTLHYPCVPQLNEFYGRRAYFDYSAVRVETDGLGVITPVHVSDLRLRGISPLNLCTEVFRLAGITAKQSIAGKVALRVIQHMGGLDSCRVFKVRGVRELLHDFSLSKTFSHKQALARIGPGFDTYKRLFVEPRERHEMEPQDVFLHLVRKKVIRPGIELECPSCQLTEWHSLNDLHETATCPFCGSPFDSGPQLRDGSWLYRVSGLFARTRDHEGAIPVSLALLQALRCLRGRGMTWLTGMDLSWDESGQTINGETDLVVLTQNHQNSPELLLGECKTGMEVGADQIDRLAAAASRFSQTGIKAFIMFAKAGGQFTEREIGLIDSRQTMSLNFILLTPTELEPYNPYENVKSDKIKRSTPIGLDQWAYYSRELYLKTKTDDMVKRQPEARGKAGGSA